MLRKHDLKADFQTMSGCTRVRSDHTGTITKSLLLFMTISLTPFFPFMGCHFFS